MYVVRFVISFPNNKERLCVSPCVRAYNSRTTGPILMKLRMRNLHYLRMLKKQGEKINFAKKKSIFPDFIPS